MRAWLRRWPGAVGPLVALAALAALDHWGAGPAAFSGVLLGMGLLAGVLLLGAWAARPWPALAAWLPQAQPVQAALRSALEMALGVVLVFVLAAPLTLLLPAPWVAQLTSDERATDLLAMMILGVGMVVAARALRAADRQTARAAQAERDAAEARADLAERERELVRAELQVLRAQVEPHFLWNTLAHVEYLIRKEPQRAQTMMAHLIVYLRCSLQHGRQEAATLAQEFDSVRAYLGLMQLRMGERLHFELLLPDELAGAVVPPMMLQTLVENAIKHGLEPLPGNALLQVHASMPAHGRLRLEVADNGVGLQPQPRTRGTGLGLRQVRERLRALHGEQATLGIEGVARGGVRAWIEWPVEADRQSCQGAP